MKRPLVTLFATSFALLGTVPAKAAGSADKVSAEALFDEGRKLMAAGKYAEACPKFEASQELDPGVGTMLNLADCYEKTGRTASAWAEFRETVSAAHDAGSRDREEIARNRANELEPKLSYLTIVPWKGQGVVVTRDGVRVEPAALGAAIPVDPGQHVIVASAPGKREWSTSANVGAAGDRVSVAVPILPDETGPETPHVGTGTPPPPPDHGKSNPGGTTRTAALVVGGVGVAGLVVGTVFTLKASSQWSDAKSKCHPYPDNCEPQGLKLEDDARSSATLATVGFVVGAVGVAAGAVLWFTAPKAESSSPSVALGVGPGSIVASGRW